MNPITAAVTAKNDPKELAYTLESLVSQSVEDFDVIIVCADSSDEIIKVANEYADEYVGFTVLTDTKRSIPSCRNLAAANAKTEHIMFIDEGDYLAPESIEKITETATEKKADIITTRYYISGEGEPYYEHWNDLLATVPDADKFDRAILNTLETEGRVFKKKFFDLYEEGYPDQPVFYNAAFLTKCVFDYGATVCGCAGAVYDRRNGVFRCSFPENGEPTEKNLDILSELSVKTLNSVAEIIKETTGTFDGDEFAYQEMLSVFFGFVTDCFYRYFWYLDDSLLAKIKLQLEFFSDRMCEERKKRISAEYADLRFPSMYMKVEDAVNMPLFSLIADLQPSEDTEAFFSSLYVSRFPFFELFLREDMRSAVPKAYADMPNLYFLSDKDFFTAARGKAKGIQITVKDSSPFDMRMLSEMSVSKAPRSLFQYIFGMKRKKFAAKTYLKHKGLNMR